MPSAPIPVTVIGGYLGAGKTTLLNRLLAGASGERLAVLVNDFGTIAVDATLIESADGSTIRLSNGCVCCSMAGGFVDAMQRVDEIEPRPDRLVVETSGVADPAAVAEYAHLPGFVLDAVVVLADAETVRTRAADALVGRQVRAQLAGGDLVVLNKIDLLGAATDGDDRLETLRRWIAGHAPEALVVTAVESAIDLDLLWGRAPRRRTATAATRERAHDDHDHAHHDDLDQHDHAHPTYVALAIEGDSAVSRDVLEDALDLATSTPSVIRVKGFVDLHDHDSRDDPGSHLPQVVHLVQVVGRRRRITPFGSGTDEPTARPGRAVSLVVIGLADSPTVTEETDGPEVVRRAAHDLAHRLGAAVVDEHR